ncbi:unnamed protein product [Adineta ricciae]|nr:unnamed protein product [Adineta ricciae]
MSTFSSYSSSVLTIKNFPLIFNDCDRQEFLEHFGATRVRCLPRIKNIVNAIIADFGSKPQASQALQRLHQLEILNRRLSVEYCPLELVHLVFSKTLSLEDDPLLNGISPGKNQLRYSLPSDRLSYSYPPINETILTNINNALLSVPAFYTQVLHLMNKMSLPCPMVADSAKKVRSSSASNITYETGEPNEIVDMDTDGDESEIDDGEEEKRVRRRFHHEDIPPKSTAEETEPVKQSSVTNDAEKKKKPIIELILPQSLRQTRKEESVPISTSHGFGRLELTKSTTSSANVASEIVEQLPALPLIPLDEIIKNRFNEDQLRLIDNGRLYRNYERGQPSRRLYIKNIATKHVDERVLHSIYDRYRGNSSEIDIRLMREGKMKGQAFVTFDSEDLALNALNDTNGFILHEKPLIVQFARTAKPKETV